MYRTSLSGVSQTYAKKWLIYNQKGDNYAVQPTRQPRRLHSIKYRSLLLGFRYDVFQLDVLTEGLEEVFGQEMRVPFGVDYAGGG